MSYTATDWQPGITPLNADSLNHLETQYAAMMAEDTGAPSGLITMWGGLLSNIPDGWMLCDGNDGRPNPFDRFPCCVPAGTEPGGTGGSTSKTTSGHTHTNPSTDNGASPNHTKLQNYTSTGSATAICDITSGSGHTHSHTQGNTGSSTDTFTSVEPPHIKLAFIIAT